MKPAQDLASIISILLIFLTCLYALTGMMPRAQSSESIPETEFSLNRALDHLKIIAKEPHYVGSPYHEEVMEYLRDEFEKLGLEVQIQEEYVLGKKYRVATRVRNVVARVKGKGTGQETGKALLLLSHYDSEEPKSYGASDAGSGVVILLEAVRAYLARGEQPLNDIIVLISDAEELGLLGAEAFVHKHPWFKDVGLVLNFEARGSGGAGIMFIETNQGNQQLIHAFNRANTSYPLSNSLFYSIYKLLPNDTDLTVFRNDGNLQGYNFAFIDDHFDYHTSQDNFERLDRNTLQHMASYLVPSLEYFAKADLDGMASEKDLVFLNFPGAGLIHYPFAWVIPMSVLAFLLLMGLILAGIKKNVLSTREIARGFLPLILSLATVGLVCYYGWELLLKIHPQYGAMWRGFTYNGHLYITALVFLGLWLTLRIYQPYLKRTKAWNLFIPPLAIWLLMSIGAGMYLPGAGFVILPVFTGILVLAVLIFNIGSEKWRTVLSTLVSLPVLVIFVPMIPLFPIALGLKITLVSALLSSLLLLLLLPVLPAYPKLKNLNKFFLIVSLLTFASASFSSRFSSDSKGPDSITYVRSEKSKNAYWGSRDREPDEFTSQFLTESPRQGNIDDPELKAAGLGRYTLYKEAALAELAPAKVTVVKDSAAQGVHHLKIRIEPGRKVNWVDLRLQHPSEVYSLEVMGEEAFKQEHSPNLIEPGGNTYLFRYYFTRPEETLDFSYSLPEHEDPSLFLIEVTHDLLQSPEIRQILPGVVPRPDHLMEKPFITNDAIVNLAEINL